QRRRHHDRGRRLRQGIRARQRRRRLLLPGYREPTSRRACFTLRPGHDRRHSAPPARLPADSGALMNENLRGKRTMERLGWLLLLGAALGMGLSSCTTEAYCFVCEDDGIGAAGESSTTRQPNSSASTTLGIGLGGSQGTGG